MCLISDRAHHGAIKATRRRRITMKDEVITVMVLRSNEFMAEVKTIPNELGKMQEFPSPYGDYDS